MRVPLEALSAVTTIRTGSGFRCSTDKLPRRPSPAWARRPAKIQPLAAVFSGTSNRPWSSVFSDWVSSVHARWLTAAPANEHVPDDLARLFGHE